MPDALCEAIFRPAGRSAHHRLQHSAVDHAGNGASSMSEETTRKCDWCGKQKEGVEEFGGVPLCPSCLDEAVICARCERPCDSSEAIEADDTNNYFCMSCADNYLTVCSECNHYFERRWNCINYPNITLCHSCSDGYSTCSDCGDAIHRDDIFYSEDEDSYFCNSCFNSHENNLIHDYGHKPRPKFKRLNRLNKAEELCFGVEVEVNHPQSMRRADAAKLFDGMNKGELFYMKNDSSIGSCGIEIVSHPMSFEWMRKNPDWLHPITRLSEHKFNSYFGYHCGMHVHMSKRSFTKMGILKIKNYLNKDLRFLMAFGMKKREVLLDYAAPEAGRVFRVERGSRLQWRRDGYVYVVSPRSSWWTGHRHIPVNVTDETVEHRWFRGTLSASAIMRNIEFCHALWSNTFNERELTHKNMYEFMEVNKKLYPNALQKFDRIKQNTNILGVI